MATVLYCEDPMEDNKECKHGILHSCGSCKDVTCSECKAVWDFRNKRAIIPVLFLIGAAAVGAHVTGLIDLVALYHQVVSNIRPIA